MIDLTSCGDEDNVSEPLDIVIDLADNEEDFTIEESEERTESTEQAAREDIRTVQRILSRRNYDAMPSIEQPMQITAELLFYQKQGVHWLINQEKVESGFCGGLLADDMVSFPNHFVFEPFIFFKSKKGIRKNDSND